MREDFRTSSRTQPQKQRNSPSGSYGSRGYAARPNGGGHPGNGGYSAGNGYNARPNVNGYSGGNGYDSRSGNGGSTPTGSAPSSASLCNILLGLSLVVMVLIAAWMLPSSAQQNMGTQAVNSSDINLQLESGIANIASAALRGVYELPQVFVLPVSCDPAPEPNEDRYELVMNSDGKRIDSGTYKDSTISVTVWKEYLDDTIYNFAEVTIAHPTQFRTAFASGSYNAATSYETPLVIATKSNAVVAMNSDFCRYNMNGPVIIRGGQLYKQTPYGWEVLLVDSNGDFHFANDGDEFVENGSEVTWNGNVIYNSFAFGPVIVRDGTAISNYEGVTAGIHGMYLTGKAKVARAAIGQIGPLHYLLCTVDGTRDERHGITVPRMAEIMAQKGCVDAYCLDGGHSATLIFDDRIVNYPAAKDNSGTQRAQSDIIYFATAIPDE